MQQGKVCFVKIRPTLAHYVRSMFVYMSEFRIVIGFISMVCAFIMWLLTFNAFS